MQRTLVLRIACRFPMLRPALDGKSQARSFVATRNLQYHCCSYPHCRCYIHADSSHRPLLNIRNKVFVPNTLFVRTFTSSQAKYQDQHPEEEEQKQPSPEESATSAAISTDNPQITTHRPVLDESNWIWHTERSNLQNMSQDALIRFCHDNFSQPLPDHILTSIRLQDPNANKTRLQAQKTKLVNQILTERNIQRKVFPMYLKEFKELAQLNTPEEKEFYQTHSHAETLALCKDYGVVSARKSRPQQVKALLRKKQTVTAEEEELLQEHGDLIREYISLVGEEQHPKHKIASCKLHNLRRLNRLRKMNLAVSDRLKSNDKLLRPLNSDSLNMDSTLTWKEQLLFYRLKRHKLFKVLGMERKTKKPYASEMRKVCRKLGINCKQL